MGHGTNGPAGSRESTSLRSLRSVCRLRDFVDWETVVDCQVYRNARDPLWSSLCSLLVNTWITTLSIIYLCYPPDLLYIIEPPFPTHTREPTSSIPPRL